MEFTAALSAFQGAIISADNVNQFSKITSRGGNEDAILNIVSSIFKFLQNGNFITMHGVNAEATNDMRKFTFYIILNGDFTALENLVELPEIDNLIWTIPTVPKCLLCEMTWALHMETFLYETIIFSNPMLALQILKPFINYLKYQKLEDFFMKVNKLSQACYKLIGRLHFFILDSGEQNLLLSEAYESFLMLTSNFITPSNEAKFVRLTEDEKYKYTGISLNSLITLTLYCLNTFSSLEKLEPEAPLDIYLCTNKPDSLKSELPSYTLCECSDNSILDCLKKCNTNLMDKCMTLIMDVSVDIFCAWSEFVNNGKSMQQSVGESCYLLLSKINKMEDFSQHPIASMLPQISRKPVDIHDIIKLADDDTIIENINSDNENRSLWLEVLLKKEGLLNNNNFVSCLITNVDLISKDNLYDLTLKVLHEVKENVNGEDAVKVLGVRLFSRCDTATKLNLTQAYFEEKLLNNTMLNNDFEDVATEMFNKLVALPEASLSDVLNLFIQSPWKTYEKIIYTAVRNSDGAKIMLKVMNLLEPFSKYYYQKHLNACLIEIIQTFSFKQLQTENEVNNFIYFVTELKKSKIICPVKLLILIIMPELHKGLTTKDTNVINLQLKLLDSAYENNELLPYRAAMLAMMSQILEVIRWNINNYSSGAQSVIEHTLNIQKNIFDSYENQIPEKEKCWLKSKLNGLLPLNMYHYKTLWNPEGKNYIEIISGEQNLSADKLTVILAKILCCTTLSEWCIIWESLQSSDDFQSLDVLHNATYLMTIAQNENFNETTWACIEYCHRNYVYIIKEKFLQTSQSSDRINTVLKKLLTIVNFLNEDRVEKLSPVFLSLLSFIASKKPDFRTDVQNIKNQIRHQNFSNLLNQICVAAS